jgi:hypothetical protein
VNATGLMHHLRAVTAVVATALVLTGCSASGRPANRPSARQCAQAEAAMRQAALMVSPFTGVTTSRDLSGAERALANVSLGMATGATSVSYLTPIPKTPPLSRELRLFMADDLAFWAALAAASHSPARPQAVGAAAQKAMRDIRTIRATCSGQ